MATIAARGVTTGRASDGTNGDIISGSSTASISQREDLANFISMITRDETPFMSSIGKTKATAIYHEWQTDTLSQPGNSRIGEGTDFVIPTGINTGSLGVTGGSNNNIGGDTDSPYTNQTFANTGPNRSRLGNYTQINGKTIAVSGTRRAIDQAGVADEYAYQLKKRGTEMRRDVEYDLVNTANVANASGARTMGTYRAWINGATVVNASGITTGAGSLPAAANTGEGSFSYNGTSGAAGTPAPRASRVALSLSDVDAVMQSIYEEGGKASKIMVSPKLRRDFSDLMLNDGGVRRNIDEKGKLRQSVDVYMSDFGDLMVVPNYIMGFANTTDTGLGDEAAFIYDPQWFSMATLRPMQEVEVGQRGDSTIGMFVEEQTLEVKNPIGCGAIYGLR